MKKLLGIGFVAVMAALLWNVAPVSAHHPEVAAVNVCAMPGETPTIEVTASAWVTGDGDHRVNNDVRIDVSGPGIATTLTASGAFAAPSYSFTRQFAVPNSVDQTLDVVVTAVDAWGPAGQYGERGSQERTTVTVDDQCDHSTTTTTAAPTSTSAAPTSTSVAPTTTVDVGTGGTTTTTVSPGGIGSGSGPDTEVGGITQVRPQIPDGNAGTNAQTGGLAFTGNNSGSLVLGGFGLLAIGSGLLVGARRRPRGLHSR